jgi:hypothetical protein
MAATEQVWYKFKATTGVLDEADDQDEERRESSKPAGLSGKGSRRGQKEWRNINEREGQSLML